MNLVPDGGICLRRLIEAAARYGYTWEEMTLVPFGIS